MVTKTTKAPKTKVTETAAVRKGGMTDAMKKLQKKYSERLGVNAWKESPGIDVITTGSLTLDIATGIGGIPRGRITEIAGMPGAGKTTLSFRAIARAQRMGYRCAFIDAEFALVPSWATKQGVDIDNLQVFTPDTLEIAAETAVILAESGEYDFIVLDSVGGAAMDAVVEGNLGDSNMGKKGKIMSDFMAKLTGPVSRNRVFFIIVNQLKNNYDMYKDEGFVAPGGYAVPYMASLRVWLFGKKLKADTHITVTAKIKKNKLATPFKEAEYLVDVDSGQVDIYGEVANLFSDPAMQSQLGIIREGAYYTIPGEFAADGLADRVHGNPGIINFLMSDLENFDNVVDILRKKLIKDADIGSREHTGAVGVETEEE